jgi:hypothetical protein
MTGLPELNYPAFRAAERDLQAHGYLTRNPVNAERFAHATPGVPRTWQWYMRRDLVMLTLSDGVALLPGWEGSTGAQLEVTVASALDMKVRPLHEWLEEERGAA